MFIASSGLVSSVGLTARSACAAMRAGISRFGELRYRDDEGEPIIGATVPGVESKGPARVAELLALALQDCLGGMAPQPPRPVPVLVCVAETDRPGGIGSRSDQVLRSVRDALGERFSPKHTRVIASGHTASFEALQHAAQFLQDTNTPSCLVCAADSYLNAASLDWLEGHWRLKTGNNSDGVIPGEGAAAAIVSRSHRSPRNGGARVVGLGFSKEKASILSGEPLLGVGLASAARSALAQAGLGMHEIDFRLSDATGEQYGLKEQALLLARTMRQRRDSVPIWHCAEAIGDTGAAAGLIQLVVADSAFRRGYAPGARAIACGSAVGPDRAVAVVAADVPGKASPNRA